MALLTLFPLAALVSKYGILWKTKKPQLYIIQFTVIGERNHTWSTMITATYLEIAQTLLLRLHSKKTLSGQWTETRKKLMKRLTLGRRLSFSLHHGAHSSQGHSSAWVPKAMLLRAAFCSFIPPKRCNYFTWPCVCKCSPYWCRPASRRKSWQEQEHEHGRSTAGEAAKTPTVVLLSPQKMTVSSVDIPTINSLT